MSNKRKHTTLNLDQKIAIIDEIEAGMMSLKLFIVHGRRRFIQTSLTDLFYF